MERSKSPSATGCHETSDFVDGPLMSLFVDAFLCGQTTITVSYGRHMLWKTQWRKVLVTELPTITIRTEWNRGCCCWASSDIRFCDKCWRVYRRQYCPAMHCADCKGELRSRQVVNHAAAIVEDMIGRNDYRVCKPSVVHFFIVGISVAQWTREMYAEKHAWALSPKRVTSMGFNTVETYAGGIRR